jgi:hypothetical protein
MLGDLGQAYGLGAKFLSQILGAFKAAVGDNHVFYFLAVQVPGGELDGFTGTDQQRRGLVQLTENLFRQTDCGKGDRDRAGADGGIGAHLFGDRKSVLE